MTKQTFAADSHDVIQVRGARENNLGVFRPSGDAAKAERSGWWESLKFVYAPPVSATKERRVRATELARSAGLSVQQVRNYVDDGILPPVERTDSGYRVFTPEHVEALDVARKLADGHGWQCAASARWAYGRRHCGSGSGWDFCVRHGRSTPVTGSTTRSSCVRRE